MDEEGSPRSKPDPTLQKEVGRLEGLEVAAQVREIARNAKVQATHGSMEYPPNSGNGFLGCRTVSAAAFGAHLGSGCDFSLILGCLRPAH